MPAFVREWASCDAADGFTCVTPNEKEFNLMQSVDAIIAQGVEAGGHIAWQVSTMVLVPRVVDAVSPVPVAAPAA